MTTFDRPTKAVLVVRCENGDEWEATPADLEKFGLAKRLDLYARTCRMLVEALGLEREKDLSSERVPQAVVDVRYLIECGVMYDHTPWGDTSGNRWPEDEGWNDEGVHDSWQRIRAALLGSHHFDRGTG